MKILFLANRTPYPPYRGDKLKIYNLAQQLHHKHELHLITFAQSDEDMGYEQELKKVFHQVKLVPHRKAKSIAAALSGVWSKMPFQVLYFKNKEMQRIVNHWVKEEQYDAIHVQHLRMAPYLADDAHTLKAILDLPDAFSLYWQRRKAFTKNFAQRIFEPIEQRRLLAFERYMLTQYPLALVCSPEDQRYLKEQHSIAHIEVLPNGVNLASFKNAEHDYSKSDTLLFTGNMDYAPNVDAVQYFVAQLLPIIKKEVPQVKFIIAGQKPVKAVRNLASEDVVVTGFVKDLATVYKEAAVVVAPLRFGAGTQNKVLEAMAMGVPVVCTEVGFEGLGIAQGEGVFKQTDGVSFALQVITLLKDEQLRKQTGTQGKKILASRFGWERVAEKLEKYFSQLQELK